jgi:FtsK/SpoIIIE family/FtsK alpha domain/Ftsk gamma domain/4TM region of DNA translocase FtsK/SpoIIIE
MPMVVRKVSQLVGLLLLVSTLFLILSVSLYTPEAPNANHYVSDGSTIGQQRGGVARKVLADWADWALQGFGSVVVLLTGIAVIETCCLLRGRIYTAVVVAGRGLLCLVAASACADLAFASIRIGGTPFLAGGIGGKWLAETVMASLSSGIAGFTGGGSSQWLTESAVTSLSRSGTYAILGMIAFGALCVGVEHPILTALWSGLRAISHASWALLRLVPQGLRGVVWAIRQGASSVSRLGQAVVRYRQVNVPQPEVDGQSEPLWPPDPAATWVVACAPKSNADAMAPSASQTAVSPAQPSTTTVRKRQLVVPIMPTLPATTSPMLSEAKSLADSQPPSVRQPLVPPVQPHAAAVQTPQAGGGTPLSTRRLHRQPITDALPSLDLLDIPVTPQRGHNPEELAIQARFLEQKLREFAVEGEVVQVLPGPVITMYEFAPAAGVKVNKIVNLQDDLALVMEAVSVRVVAPIPGKAVVGIEIPHKRRETVRFRDLLDSEEWHTSTSKLSLALGKDILGRPVITDLALIPHLLIAGATGSGKSVGLNSLICSLLFRATPTDVRMIMIDPKMLEFSVYDGIPHLLVPVVTEPKKAAIVLRRVVEEMGRRYQILAAQGVRSIAQYNQMLEEENSRKFPGRVSAQTEQDAAPTPAEKLPYLVVVIDELSDLMMVSAREVEDSLMRLAQMARAAGIHLIVATQRPSVDVLTGVIKANFPARLSFQVTSKVDSRTILDTNGAETLLGRGDMLFLAPGTSKPQRVHGAYVSEAEISRLVEAWKAVEQTRYDDGFLVPGSDRVSVEEDEYDEKYDEAIALVTKMGQASISMLQRRLRVGYNRAARMIEMMEKDGIVGPADGIKPREVLVRNTFDDV